MYLENNSNILPNRSLLQFIVSPKFSVYRHVILISLFSAGLYAKNDVYMEPVNSLTKVVMLLSILSLFYLNMYRLVPALIFKEKYIQYFFWIVFVFGIITMLILFLKSYLKPYIRPEYQEEDQGSDLLGLTVYFIFMAASTAVKLFQRLISHTRRIVELETATMKAELGQLKNQINPHFLFNMLNNVNVLTRKDPEKASQVIMKLSTLLRYQLYDSAREQVLLTAEIKFLEDFLNLEKVRRDNFEIIISKDGELEGVQLAPLLFIIFAENAVKHNEDAENKSYVHLHFKMKSKQLTFQCMNSKPGKSESDNHIGGLGLANIKRRLELLYPGKHRLVIQDLDDQFNVNLIIEL